MPDSEKQIDEKKGDEVLRRMLKTPPDPKAGRERKAKKEAPADEEPKT